MIAEPAANHWYVNAVPVVHAPGFAVSFLPTFTVPEIVGVFTVATFAVALLVLAAVVCPDFLPVAFTVSVLPVSVAFGVWTRPWPC